MQLRPATSEDASALYALYFAAARSAPGAFYDAAQRRAWAPEPEMPDWFAARFDGTVACLAEDAAGPLAFMVLTTSGHLDLAYAHPRAMGTGAAGSVYDHILGQARQLGLRRLDTEASHYARRFLARRGWVVTRRFEKTRNGAVFDQVEMELQLSPNAAR